jgi:4-amino-4-deoxy-L-arabinose transferase-like glycosyltransferase
LFIGISLACKFGSKNHSSALEKIFLKRLSLLGPYGVLILLAVFAFLPGLGGVHLFDWDEINFAEAAREMLVTGKYAQVQINFQSFYEKPPLFFWLQAASMHLWGIHEFAARFPNAIGGMLTLCTLYYMGQQEGGRRLGFYWALLHGAALLPHFYFKTGIIDPWFNYFMFLGFYGLTQLYTRPSKGYTALSGTALGLAALTKGPVGYLLPILAVLVYSLRTRQLPHLSRASLIIWIVCSVASPLVWLGYETCQQGPAFIKAFWSYQLQLFREPVAGHSQPFYYHFLVVFIGCFPTAVLAAISLWPIDFNRLDKRYTLMQLLFWVVMAVFSVATTKIIHYSSLSYFPISFLAAYSLYRLEQQQYSEKVFKRLALWLLGVGTFIGVVIVAVPIVALYRAYIVHVIADPFIIDSLLLPVGWSWADMMPGISYLLSLWAGCYYFKKRAWMHFVVYCFLATTLCLGLGSRQIVPKIEAHLQGSAIAFYKSLAGQEAYVTTIDFKSYAPLFYFQQPPTSAVQPSVLPWLLTGPIDKPVYFVLKKPYETCMKNYPSIQLVAEAGGYCFFKREPAA